MHGLCGESTNTKPVILFGTSMGAAAVLKAMKDYPLEAGSACFGMPARVVIQNGLRTV